MNLNAIRLFLHVVQRGSLMAAANELNMSTSAASRLLGRLERSSGLKLFSRDRHRLYPTEEGQQYFDECYRVLVAVDELPRAAKRLASGARARLKLLSVTRFATTLMIPAIGRFLKNNSNIEIDFQTVLRHEIEQASSERSFDVGVVTLPLKNPVVATAPLFDMPATVIMRRDHPLAKRGRLRIAEVAAQRLIVLPVGALIRADIEDMFAAAGLEFRPQITVTSGDLACQTVLKTDAVTILEPVIPLTLNPDKYALVPLEPPHLVHIGIATPALKPDSKVAEDFKTCLREEAKSIEQRMAKRFGASNPAEARRTSRR